MYLRDSGINYTNYRDQYEGYLVRTITRGQYDIFKELLDLYMHVAQDSCARIDLRSLMYFVIAAGNARMLKLLIERGYTSAVHSHDQPSEPSPLSHALSCKLGQTEVLETLIAAGEVIESEIMGSIISMGSCKAIRLAVERGLPFQIDAELLRKTIERRDPEVLVILLPLIISDGVLNERTGGLSALHHALLHPIPRLALPLIKAGIDLDALDRDGKTALHYALSRRHFDIAILLISAGCRLNVADEDLGNELHRVIRLHRHSYNWNVFEFDPDSDSGEEFENTVYFFRETPVDGYPDQELKDRPKVKQDSFLTVVYLLLVHGADVDLHGHSSNDSSRELDLETPLWYAIKYGYRDVVWAILTMGACRPDLTITDAAGRTPLQFAKERGNRPIIRMLEEYEESPWMMFSGLSDVSMEDA
ncbi:ankyrin repeat-containing domain protein [Penicillium malachiteum]|uniref:Ankyrin repeat-containing domain protein n=1 Tax=Penicillium malachiteum TaxID=1324776 RepID=A0AAD6HPY0_9EURO|nr:ankyrin repeat-containing domain protein [Penicillium malachiteum]